MAELSCTKHDSLTGGFLCSMSLGSCRLLAFGGLPSDACTPYVVHGQSWVPQNRPKPSWPGYGK